MFLVGMTSQNAALAIWHNATVYSFFRSFGNTNVNVLVCVFLKVAVAVDGSVSRD